MKKFFFLFLFFVSYFAYGQDTLGIILAKDAFELEVVSSGCFHHAVSLYKYNKKNNLRTLEVYNVTDEAKMIYRFKVEVSENDLKVLKQYFEKGLKQASKGCTSEERYVLRSGGFYSGFIDDSCEHSSMDNWLGVIERRKRL